MTPRVDISSWATYSEAYGFQWWLDTFNFRQQGAEAWVTAGYGGQYTFCFPDLNLVVAFTGRNYTNPDGVTRLYEMVQDFVIASVNQP